MPDDRIKDVAGKVFVGDGLAVPTSRPEPQSALADLLAEVEAPTDGLQSGNEPAEFTRPSERLVRTLEQALLGDSNNARLDTFKVVADKVVRLALDPVEQLTLGVVLFQALSDKGQALRSGDDVTVPVGREDLWASAAPDQSAAVGSSAAGPSSAPAAQGCASVLLDALTLCVDAPSFRRIANAVIRDFGQDGEGTGNSDVGHLRRYLQARARLDEGPGGNDDFVRRVSESSLSALKDRGTPPSDVQRDHFYWDSGFRSEAAGTPLDTVRNVFETCAKHIHAEAGGLLEPVAKHGLLGLTHHNWADITKDIDEALKPAGDGGSSSLHAAKLKALGAALRQHVLAAVTRGDEALRKDLDQTPWARPEFKGIRPPLATVVRAVCMRELVERMADSGESPLLTGEQALRGFAPGDIAGKIRHHLTEAGVPGTEIEAILKKKIEQQDAVGLHQVLKMARKQASEGDAGVRSALEACGPLSRAIEARHGQRPSGVLGVIDTICNDFLPNVYFGNHLQVARGWSADFAPRVSPNFARIVDPPPRGSDNALPPSTSLSPSLYGAPAPHGTPQPSDGESTWYKVVASLGFAGALGGGSTALMRFGAATHGTEIFLGNESSSRGEARLAVPFGRNGNELISGGLTFGVGGELRRNEVEGLIFRVDRQHGPNKDGGYDNNDEAVRDAAARLARKILEPWEPEPAPVGNRKHRLDAVIDALVEDAPAFALNLLSLQQTKRSSVSNAVAGSAGGSVRVTGEVPNLSRLGGEARIGVGGKFTKSSGSQTEADGSRFSVTAARDSSRGFQRETTVSVGGVAQFGDGKVTVPLTGLLNSGEAGSDSSVVVKVRTPKRHGEIVPEKTFLDVETGNLDVFKKFVYQELDEWEKMDAATGGGLHLTEFFALADNARRSDHVYYLRKRLHPDVARRVDELASLQKVLAHDSPMKGELSAETKRLVGDKRAWVPASLIIYQKEARTQDLGVGRGIFRLPAVLTNIFRAKEFRQLESEREICFHTGGWAGLHTLEQSEPIKRQIAALLGDQLELVVDPGATPIAGPTNTSRPEPP